MEGIHVQVPGTLTHCSSGRRRSSVSSSPEFEFWMLRNPSLPQPDLLSADELFSDGLLLPLDLVPHDHPRVPDESPGENPSVSRTEMPEGTGSDGPDVSPAVVTGSSAASAVGSSKRWRDIFKKGEKKSSKGGNEETVKEKKRGGLGGGASAAELNINIWPFSRSRSAGNGGARPRVGAGSGLAHRKVSSAPCSRSNSAGESKSRKWPASPTRVRVHLGRSSPVWQVRRSGISTGRSIENPSKSGDKALKKEGELDKIPSKDVPVSKPVKREGTDGRRKNSAAAHGGATNGVPKARVLNLNVPMCIGYRNNLSCRSDVGRSTMSASAAAASDDGDGGGAGVSGEAVRGSHLFNIRNLFTKKVY
ncbi:unnamed protein product [Cuscuta campestris]|uniref:Uncharacterized protein n=1 Tax=Cuscuta campestris TaxID=132261 RepID=A0A484MJD6_9ASTE|nr:unnamed protein product [Cuscuta campestris]